MTTFSVMERMLSAIVVGQVPGEGATPTSVWVLGALLILAVGVIVWAVPRTRTLSARIDDINNRIDESKEETRKLAEKSRKQDKDLEQKREELKKMKKEIAAQRKKNHSVQEENKKFREELGQQRSDFDRRQMERPAFADEEKAREPEEPKPVPKKPEESGVQRPADDDRLQRLEQNNTKLKNELEEIREQIHGDKSELTRLRKRVEDYRRIDIINAGKREALEEKVRHLGRQYYEAVTEVAVLKGEVPAIPPPEEQPDTKPTSRKRKEKSKPAEVEAEAGSPPPETNEPAGPGAPGARGSDVDAGTAAAASDAEEESAEDRKSVV